MKQSAGRLGEFLTRRERENIGESKWIELQSVPATSHNACNVDTFNELCSNTIFENDRSICVFFSITMVICSVRLSLPGVYRPVQGLGLAVLFMGKYDSV